MKYKVMFHRETKGGEREMREHQKLKFFETKVVKVKKEKECIGEICIRGERKPLYIENNRIYFEGKEKSKGNWVNGENIKKIKFPCFCSFMNGCTKCYGEINKSYDCENNKDVYEVSNITKQVDGNFGQMFSVIYTSDTLQDLIKYHDIHILKGKVIIWEEE